MQGPEVMSRGGDPKAFGQPAQIPTTQVREDLGGGRSFRATWTTAPRSRLERGKPQSPPPTTVATPGLGVARAPA